MIYVVCLSMVRPHTHSDDILACVAGIVHVCAIFKETHTLS